MKSSTGTAAGSGGYGFLDCIHLKNTQNALLCVNSISSTVAAFHLRGKSHNSEAKVLQTHCIKFILVSNMHNDRSDNKRRSQQDVR